MLRSRDSDRSPLRRRLRSFAGLSLCFALAGLPAAPALAEEGKSAAQTAIRTGNVAFDVLVLRPSQAAATLIGAALFVPAAILSSPGGRHSIDTAWQHFVMAPFSQVYDRPLGEF